MHVDVQNASASGSLPSPQQLSLWASAAAADQGSELLIRLVDVAESAELNQQYRQKSGPTNVLSFPFEAPPGIACDLLGDLVVCAPVVEREAREQGKELLAHWAHMIVHGTLHLQGYDHVEEDQARDMEEREIAILRELGFANPYEETP